MRRDLKSFLAVHGGEFVGLFPKIERIDILKIHIFNNQYFFIKTSLLLLTDHAAPACDGKIVLQQFHVGPSLSARYLRHEA